MLELSVHFAENQNVASLKNKNKQNLFCILLDFRYICSRNQSENGFL